MLTFAITLQNFSYYYFVDNTLSNVSTSFSTMAIMTSKKCAIMMNSKWLLTLGDLGFNCVLKFNIVGFLSFEGILYHV